MGTKAWARVLEDIWEGHGYSGFYPATERLIADDIDHMLEGEWRPFIDKGMRLGRLSADFSCRVVERKNFETFIEDDEGEAIAEMGKFDDLEDKIDGLEYTVSNLEHTVKGLENTIKDLEHTIKGQK
jgi:hypothetical protein